MHFPHVNNRLAQLSLACVATFAAASASAAPIANWDYVVTSQFVTTATIPSTSTPATTWDGQGPPPMGSAARS